MTNIQALALLSISLFVAISLFRVSKKIEKSEIKRQKLQKYRKASYDFDFSTLQELKESGFNINGDNHLALDKAAWKGNLPIAKLCVENGATREAKELAFVFACCANHMPIVEFLIDSGVNPRAFKDSALIHCASYGHFELAEYLMEKGCDLHSIVNYETPSILDIRSIGQDFVKSKQWAEKYIRIKELAEKLDKELAPKTTTKTGRIKI